MPVPGTSFFFNTAHGTAAPDVKTITVPIFQNSGIRAHVMLVNVVSTGQSQFWGASAYISQYVQNGQVSPPGQVAYELHGSDITEILFTVNALEATVVGAILVEYF